MHDALSAEEQHYLEQARALIPVLAGRAAATSAARDVLPETIADFHRLGILRIIQPRRFGGLQLRFSAFSRIVETITEGCASSGWVYADSEVGGLIRLTLQPRHGRACPACPGHPHPHGACEGCKHPMRIAGSSPGL
jgi:alkylation response protein AidB-like acyl-CoA dehydrogenase